MGVADKVADAALVQRQGPWGGSCVAGEGDVLGVAAPGLGGADGRDGLLDQRPDGGKSGRADSAGSRLAGQRGEADAQEGVVRAPSLVQAGAGGGVPDRLQWLAVPGVTAERLLDQAEFRGCLPELGVLLPPLLHLRRERHQVRGDGGGCVERCCKQRPEDLLAHDGRLVLRRRAHAGDLGGRSSVPGSEPVAVTVGGQQLPVAGQLDDGSGGGAGAGLFHSPDHGPGSVLAQAPFREVAVAVVLGHSAERGDLLGGQPVHPPGRLGQPPEAAGQGQGDTEGAGQDRDLGMAGGKPCENVLLDGQPPARVADGGEVQPGAGRPAHLNGQALDVAEVPYVVVEHGGVPAPAELEPGCRAHVSARQDAGASLDRCVLRSGHHVVRSSGRRGICRSAALPASAAAAAIRGAG